MGPNVVFTSAWQHHLSKGSSSCLHLLMIHNANITDAVYMHSSLSMSFHNCPLTVFENLIIPLLRPYPGGLLCAPVPLCPWQLCGRG